MAKTKEVKATEQVELSQGCELVRCMLKELFIDMKDIEISALDTEAKGFTITIHDRVTYDLFRDHFRIPQEFGEVNITLAFENNKMIEEEFSEIMKDNIFFSNYYKGKFFSAAMFKDTTVDYRSDNAFNPWGYSANTPEQIAATFFTGINITTDFGDKVSEE